MISGFFNDVAQRLLSLNKYEQRENLRKILKKVDSSLSGMKVLDFGCGTGLFMKVFESEGMNYFGYDIDESAIAYAQKMHTGCGCVFTTTLDEISSEIPFDVVVANCCFHHIADQELAVELEKIGSMLTDDGIFIVMDLLLVENEKNALRRLYRKLERGAYVRSIDKYKSVLRNRFVVINECTMRTHLFSVKNFPIHNDLAVFVCGKLF